MKRNAILIAGIMFVAAGCASQGGYADRDTGSDTHHSSYPSATYLGSDSQVTGEVLDRDAAGRLHSPQPMDPPTALEHDPAHIDRDSASADVGSDADRVDADSDVRTRSQSYSADSSVRGGSDRARGHDLIDKDFEGSSDGIDARVQADSSIRGGSNDARGQGWRYHDHNEVEASKGLDRVIKADSSIRGGSDRARGFDVKRHHYSEYSGDETDVGGSAASSAPDSRQFSANVNTSDGFYDESGGNEGSLELSQNWISQPELDTNAEASGAAATFESDSVSSEDNGVDNSSAELESSELQVNNSPSLDTDINVDVQNNVDSSAKPEMDVDSENSSDLQETDDSFASDLDAPIDSNLSIRSEIESDGTSSDVEVSGDLDAQAEDPYHPTDSKHELEAQGGFEAFESGSVRSEDNKNSDLEVEANSYQPDFEADSSSRSGDTEWETKDIPEGQVSVFGGPSNDLFKTNPARGIGAPAQTEVNSEEFHSGTDTASSDLASQVKAQLSRESTGTFGVTKDEVRNVQVTSSADGKVTLKGSVSTEQHKQSLGIRAGEVAGVKAVDNQLTVSADSLPQNRE